MYDENIQEMFLNFAPRFVTLMRSSHANMQKTAAIWPPF